MSKINNRNFKVTVVFNEESATVTYYITFKKSQYALFNEIIKDMQTLVSYKHNVLPDEEQFKFTEQHEFTLAVDFLIGRMVNVFNQ